MEGRREQCCKMRRGLMGEPIRRGGRDFVEGGVRELVGEGVELRVDL